MRTCRPTVDLVGTGIVFVVLVAIWAAYFLQYWSRRREHLATARSVEAFSEAMRVLERRPALRASTDSRMSAAYAVSPARVVSARPAPRPQVMAKPHSPAAPHHPRGGDLSMRMPTLPRIPTRQDPARPPARSGVAGRGSARLAGPHPSRQVRGLTFLALVAATLVTLALAAVGILLWIAPAVAAAATVGGFLWLRSGVQAEIRARRAARRPVRRTRPAGARPREAAPTPRRAGHAPGAGQSSDEHEVADVGHAGELHAATTFLAESEDGSSSLLDASPGDPDGWQPVPVPPPTYTLKAKAERPTQSAETLTGEPVGFEEDLADEIPEFDGAQHGLTQHPAQPGERPAVYGT